MNKRNYALMSVLYDNKEADLYNDIYFPIIRYGIAKLYNDQEESEKYYEQECLQKTIDGSFGIKIPLVVLKQAIRAVSRQNKEISIKLIENGNKFQIEKAWDIKTNESIELKLQETEENFSEIEELFQEYLKRETVETSKTFLDFYIDNSEDIYKYLENLDSAPTINENYIHLTKFLTELKKSNASLFIVANNIFWGSVISAFLKRETDLNIKPNDRVDYYLDSSLVLAILDLDSESNVLYAKELLEIINKSGNTPKVHPLTLREINNILYSVEKDQVPKPNSAIEEAFYRRNLTASKILQIRNNLNTLVDNEKIVIEFCSDIELNKIQESYKKKAIVLELKESRSYTTNDNIRDIHDIFMNDFIKKKRGQIASIEKINSYFISLNRDLIDFIKGKSSINEFSTIIHPSRVISTLWIHNSECSIVKNNGLTEVMSRCFALNNTDVRRKLRLISRYFNDEDFTEENYKALFLALVDRSNKVLNEVSKIEENIRVNPTDKDSIKQSLETAIRIASEEKAIKETNLTETYNQLEVISGQLNTAQEAADTLGRKLTEINEKVNEKDTQIVSLQDKLTISENNSLRDLKEKIALYKDRIAGLEKLRDSSISMKKFWIVLFLEVIAILISISGIILLVINLFAEGWMNTIYGVYESFKSNPVILVTFGISFVSIVCRASKLYIFTPKVMYNSIRKEQLEYWDEHNSKLSLDKTKLKELEKDLVDLSK